MTDKRRYYKKNVTQHDIDRMARLVHCRESIGLIKAEIARRAHVTSAQMNAWELRACTPTTKHIQTLAEIYGVTPQYLLHGIEEKEEPTLPVISEESIFRNCFTFADRLNAAISDRNITPDRLALFTAMPENELLGYLQGSNCEVLARIMVIAEVLSVDRCALAFGVKR